jgi:hypothetical protein
MAVAGKRAPTDLHTTQETAITADRLRDFSRMIRDSL